MAFSVQDDSGSVQAANAYVAVAEFKAFQDERGGNYSLFTDSQIEQSVVKATDYLDSRYAFVGVQRSVDQGTQFPRYLVGQEFGASYPRSPLSGLPRALRHATCLLAMRALGGATLLPDPVYNPEGQVTGRRSKVGPVESEITFAAAPTAAQQEAPRYPDVDLLLRNAGLLGPTGSRRLYRG